MHIALQFFIAAAPKSLELQLMATLALIGSNSMTWFGQMEAHLPQPVQRRLSMTGNPSSPMCIAPKGQERVQLPKPKQPNLQNFGPC